MMTTFQLNKETKENFEDSDLVCMICSKKLRNVSSNNICKSCKRKIYATNIIKELELYNIKPNIPFKKEDLERLNFHKIKVQDYIWTLQEMNLINENSINNTYSLKDDETINKFISKYEIYSNYKDTSKKEVVKKHILSKKCRLCKKELNITNFYKSINSSDGYDEYCKSCKSSIKTASSLQNLLKFIRPNEKFKINDLERHYTNKLELQGQIWNLQEKDLIKSEEDNTIFFLVNKNILDEYLEKYLIDKSSEKEETKHIEENIKSNFKDEELDTKNERISYFVSYKDKEVFEILVKGVIKNETTFEFLHTLETFENYLKRVITYKLDMEFTKILVELKSDRKNWNKILKQINAQKWNKI